MLLKMNKFKWKQFSVRFPDLRDSGMRLKMLCLQNHVVALRTQRPGRGLGLGPAPVMAWKRSALYSR